jgi:hypothetical protein
VLETLGNFDCQPAAEKSADNSQSCRLERGGFARLVAR